MGDETIEVVTAPAEVVTAPAPKEAPKTKAPKLAANQKLLDSGSVYTAH